MKNFSSHIKKLKKVREHNPQQCSLLLGKGDAAWTIIYCPASDSYYAMSMASGRAIMSGSSAIRPAYRIDSKTGKPESVARRSDHKALLSGTDNEPRLFAVKIFSGDKAVNKISAQNEAEALAQHQFAELTTAPDGQPLIISDFYPGQTLCDTAGKPNKKLLDALTIQDRLALILQVANQYCEIHHIRKNGKTAWIHADVKGSNIVVHAPKNGAKNAWVIDFGSGKRLEENTDKVSTGLLGLTPNAIPPEVLDSASNRYVQLDDPTGSLSRQSDIYALGAVFAAMLGASNPYARRQENISTGDGYDLAVLQQQIEEGFDFQGLLEGDNNKIPGYLQRDVACAFINRVEEEAPNSKTILEDESLPSLGYILYKDQLLYIDKSKAKVFNRKNTKPVEFKRSIAEIKKIETTHQLKIDELNLINSQSNRGNESKQSIDELASPLMKDFICQMVDKNPANRPSIDEVQQFFAVVNKLVAMVIHPDETRTAAEKERAITICLIQLTIFKYRSWHAELPVTSLNGENISQVSGTLGSFDFSELENNDTLLDSFLKLFHDREQSNAVQPFNICELSFLTVRSDGRKTVDALLAKLGVNRADERQNAKIEETVLRLGKKKSAVLLSMPVEMIDHLVNDAFVSISKEMVDAFKRCETFIENHFESRYSGLKKSLEPVLDYYSGQDALDKLGERELFANLSRVREQKNDEPANQLLNAIEDSIASKIVMNIRAYLESISHLDGRLYQRFSCFGLFGYKVGQKRDAANALIQAIQTDNYAAILQDKKQLGILRQGKLGIICSPLLDIMSQQMPNNNSLRSIAEMK